MNTQRSLSVASHRTRGLKSLFVLSLLTVFTACAQNGAYEKPSAPFASSGVGGAAATITPIPLSQANGSLAPQRPSVTTMGGSQVTTCDDTLIITTDTERFWQAYQRCPSGPDATLTVTSTSLDASGNRVVKQQVFAIQGASSCQIHIVTNFSVTQPTGNLGGASSTIDCARLTHDDGGTLHFLDCGVTGSIDIPRQT